MARFLGVLAVLAVLLGVTMPPSADSACCYFAAKDADILQPAQKAFITWDPREGVETFTVQPRFEGNAKDFGMVIPTPSRPKLDEMPRDFFKEHAVYTILKKREQPQSKLLREEYDRFAKFAGKGQGGGNKDAKGKEEKGHRTSTVKELEKGIVGNLHYKIIDADNAHD